MDRLDAMHLFVRVAELGSFAAVAQQMGLARSVVTRQIAALTTAQIEALSTEQIQALETIDIAALRTNQILALTTTQISVGLTTEQVAALTTTQVESFTSTQISVFTTEQIQYLDVSTPLILDLDGDGIETQSIRNGVQFDIYGTGEKVQTGWVSGGDGLLVLDRNGDGSINGGGELFGEATVLSNGDKAKTGYEALADLDSNADGVISQGDTAFDQLQVWVDGNSDGISQAGELFALKDLGITELNLNAISTPTQDNGNIIGLNSSYQTADGQSHEMADVWFLTGKVNNLVQAMSSYGESGGTSNALPVDPASQTGSSASGTVGQLVGVMSQYDPNGQPLLGNAPGAAPATLTQPIDPNNPVVYGLLVPGT